MVIPMSLDARRWFALVSEAKACALAPNASRGDLQLYAKETRNRPCPGDGGADIWLFSSLREQAYAFGAANLARRLRLAAGLLATAEECEAVMRPPPTAAAEAVGRMPYADD